MTPDVGGLRVIPVLPLGQAGFRLEFPAAVVYIDPYLSDAVEECEGSLYRRQTPAPFEARSVRDADWVLISHGHLDHCDPAALPEIARASPDCLAVVALASAPAPAAALTISTVALRPTSIDAIAKITHGGLFDTASDTGLSQVSLNNQIPETADFIAIQASTTTTRVDSVDFVHSGNFTRTSPSALSNGTAYSYSSTVVVEFDVPVNIIPGTEIQLSLATTQSDPGFHRFVYGNLFVEVDELFSGTTGTSYSLGGAVRLDGASPSFGIELLAGDTVTMTLTPESSMLHPTGGSTDTPFYRSGSVQLFATVPESSTALLLGLGLVGLAARRQFAQ